ncbi:uncharacterized protein LOC115223524 [Octopus sinensis]|uniref:Uncharacterized protein LOC115223524 n=1 Tax=Octopus sinensis TaxID=2607531 RepID=A0A6P7TFH9_9MOLL|nr:uncharacterized protein LOC115223524 [Octopus sinensis]
MQNSYGASTDSRKSWLASAFCIKDSHLGECLLSTNAREDRRLILVLKNLVREYQDAQRMQRIHVRNFLNRSYVLHHKPIQCSGGHLPYIAGAMCSRDVLELPPIRVANPAAQFVLNPRYQGSIPMQSRLPRCNKQLFRSSTVFRKH